MYTGEKVFIITESTAIQGYLGKMRNSIQELST